MNFLIQRLYGETSFTIMDILIEEQGEAAAGESEENKRILKRIYESNDLDERHLICAEFLGYKKQAQDLRDWLAKKNRR